MQLVLGAHRLKWVWFGLELVCESCAVCRSSVQVSGSLRAGSNYSYAAPLGPGPPTGAASARKQRPNNRGRGFFSYCSTTPVPRHSQQRNDLGLNNNYNNNQCHPPFQPAICQNKRKKPSHLDKQCPTMQGYRTIPSQDQSYRFNLIGRDWETKCSQSPGIARQTGGGLTCARIFSEDLCRMH